MEVNRRKERGRLGCGVKLAEIRIDGCGVRGGRSKSARGASRCIRVWEREGEVKKASEGKSEVARRLTFDEGGVGKVRNSGERRGIGKLGVHVV